MADADVQITAGTGPKVDTRTVGAGTDEHRQVVVVGDPVTAANVQSVNSGGEAVVGGGVAHDDVDTGNPIKIGGKAGVAAPANVAAGDRVEAHFDTRGRLGVHIASFDGTGSLNIGTTTPADGGTNNIASYIYTLTREYLFNGTTWDRARNLTSFDTAVAAPVRLGAAAVADPEYRYTSVSLSSVLNSAQTWDVNGRDETLVHVGTTTTGTVIFEVTADGSNWVQASVRDTQTGLWANGAFTPTANKTYRIVTNSWRTLRARTASTLGSTVALTANLAARASLLNAIDTGPAPHNYGHTPWFAGADITTATTTNIKTPTSGKRLVVTHVTLGTGGTTAGLVTVWLAASADTTVNLNTDDVLFRGVLTPTANATPGLVLEYPNNPPVGTADFLLKVTTAAATTLYVTARGYEI
jgi:hypothetical protein